MKCEIWIKSEVIGSEKYKDDRLQFTFDMKGGKIEVEEIVWQFLLKNKNCLSRPLFLHLKHGEMIVIQLYGSSK